MGSVSVTIRIPMLNNERDFMIPEKMRVKDVIMLIIKILNVEYGIPQSSENLLLLDMSDGKVLGNNDCFETLEIFDGARLMLV